MDDTRPRKGNSIKSSVHPCNVSQSATRVTSLKDHTLVTTLWKCQRIDFVPVATQFSQHMDGVKLWRTCEQNRFCAPIYRIVMCKLKHTRLTSLRYGIDINRYKYRFSHYFSWSLPLPRFPVRLMHRGQHAGIGKFKQYLSSLILHKYIFA